jgi:Uma2 family endonuclease
MAPRFTRSDYERLPEGFPAQLVAGGLVKEPSPTYGHQYVASVLHARLAALVGLGRALHAPQDVGVDEFNVYQPDVLVTRAVPSFDARDVGIPLLAIEVLSPATARRDRDVKRRRLLHAGVGEVWIVDPATETVEVYDAAGVRAASGSETIRSRVVPGFDVVPASLFARPEGSPPA